MKQISVMVSSALLLLGAAVAVVQPHSFAQILKSGDILGIKSQKVASFWDFD